MTQHRRRCGDRGRAGRQGRAGDRGAARDRGRDGATVVVDFRDKARRAEAGTIPTVGEFAAVVAAAATAEVPSGHTFYVGGDDYLDE